MPKAQWTTKPQEVSVGTDADGTFSASIPLYDGKTKAATLRFTITADRALTVLVENEPGSAGLSGFSAWSREA
jgi:hypothetical protein